MMKGQMCKWDMLLNVVYMVLELQRDKTYGSHRLIIIIHCQTQSFQNDPPDPQCLISSSYR